MHKLQLKTDFFVCLQDNSFDLGFRKLINSYLKQNNRENDNRPVAAVLPHAAHLTQMTTTRVSQGFLGTREHGQFHLGNMPGNMET